MTRLLLSEAVAVVSALMFLIGSAVAFKKKIKNYFVGDLQTAIDDVKARQLRLELNDLIEHDPTNINYIMHVYDEYQETGKNSPIHNKYGKWKKKYVDRKVKNNEKN
jgi:formiminotetrahydrofolate cyclodeaminase